MSEIIPNLISKHEINTVSLINWGEYKTVEYFIKLQAIL